MTLSFESLMKENDDKLLHRKVLVAFSGGKDSCALLHWLNKNKSRLSVSLGACHVNHMIRGENANIDEAFCRKFCLDRAIEFYSEKRDVPALAKKDKQGLEHAARKMRYDALYSVAEKNGYELILTAHTKDDMAETFFIRVFQGASLYTLGGIMFENNKLLRPMLKITTEDICKYNEIENIETTFDETNDDTSYLRNWIRSTITAEIKEYNPRFVDKIIQLMNQSAELNEQMKEAYSDLFVYEDDVYIIDVKKFLDKGYNACSWVLRHILTDCFRVERRHIDSIIELASETKSSRINLPDGFVAEISYTFLRIYHSEKIAPVDIVKKAGVEKLKVRDKTLVFEDKLIDTELTIRTRRDGDISCRKKLKDIFINKKIELFHRDRTLIAEKNGEIIWVENILDNKFIKLC